uniref:Uncharacterized protein n=1 Tax=Panagrolaimus davidi TaxID=227884 RepID=A0A914QRM5_9BILA
MDLPVGSIAAVISRGSFGPRVGATIPSSRAKFFAKYFRQNFALPDSIIHYIAKNPKTWMLYQKIIRTCKYFFVKNPILVVPLLSYIHDDVWVVDADVELLIDLNKIKCKFWVTEEFDVLPGVNDYNPNILSSNILKLYKCDVIFLFLICQTISYNDLSFFISVAEEIGFKDVNLKDENGKILPLEKIIEASIKARRINMQKNQRTSIELYFDSSISDEYKARIEEIIDEIYATGEFDYKPPSIQFNELDE